MTDPRRDTRRPTTVEQRWVEFFRTKGRRLLYTSRTPSRAGEREIECFGRKRSGTALAMLLVAVREGTTSWMN